MLKNFLPTHNEQSKHNLSSFDTQSGKDNSNKEKIIAMPQDKEAHRVFNNFDATTQIISQLPIRDLFSSQRVSRQWQAAIKTRLISLLASAPLTENEYALFFKLPTFLQYIIAKQVYDRKVEVAKIKLLFSTLPLSPADRMRNIFPKAQSHNDELCSDIGMILYLVNLVAENNISSVVKIASPLYAALIFAEFISSEKINFDNSFLGQILTKNCYKALREKIITPEQIIQYQLTCSYWDSLLSNSGMEVLKQGFITFDQAQNKKLKFFFSDCGLQALIDRLITPTQIKIIHGSGSKAPVGDLQYLLTPNGLKAWRLGCMTPERAASYKDGSFLMHNRLLTALNEELLTAADVLKIQDLPSLFQNDSGLSALRENVITSKQAKEHTYLTILQYPNGVKALKKRLITLEQTKLFPGYDKGNPPKSFAVLLSDLGLQALEEGLITVEQAVKFYPSRKIKGPKDNLDEYLTYGVLLALRKKIMTFEQVQEYQLYYSLNEKKREKLNKIIFALEHKLLLLTDFNVGEKYYSGIPPRDLNNLISKFEKRNHSCQVIQRLWRTYRDKKQCGISNPLEDLKKVSVSGLSDNRSQDTTVVSSNDPTPEYCKFLAM